MRDATRDFLLNYLGDELKWPFLWDGTMGGKYVVGSTYIRLFAAIRDECDILITTMYGFQLRKQNKVVSNERLTTQPTHEFIDAMSLILSRDRIVRRLVRKNWETETADGLEVGYLIAPDEYEQHSDEIMKAHITRGMAQINEKLEEMKSKLSEIPLRRAYIPTEALANSVRFANEMMQVFLKDGRTISVPLAWFPLLHQSTPAHREHYEIVGGGLGLYWPELEEDVLVASLLTGADFESSLKQSWRQMLSGAGS